MSCGQTKSMRRCVGVSEHAQVRGVGGTSHLWSHWSACLVSHVDTHRCTNVAWHLQHPCPSAEYRGAYLGSEGSHPHLGVPKGPHSLGWHQTPRAWDTVCDPTRKEFHPPAPRGREVVGLSLVPPNPPPPDP